MHVHWLHVSPGAHRNVGIDLVSLEADATHYGSFTCSTTGDVIQKLIPYVIKICFYCFNDWFE